MPVRSPQSIWETALGQLEIQVTRPNFETWLRPTVGLRMEDDRLIVGVHTDFALEWLRTRLSPIADRTVARVLGSDVTVSFEVLGAHTPAVAQTEASAQPAPLDPQRCGLDARFTFDSFVVLNCNRLAYRAARKVAAADDGYGLLLLRGPSGSGKTHLLHAIGSDALRAGRTVIALTGEGFVDRYGTAVREGRPHTFRQAFSTCDLLLLDDLPFITARPASQEQFFHLFNTLRQARCTIVLTTHISIETLPDISDRLRTRIGAALASDLSLPSGKERLEYLQARAAGLGAAIDGQILTIIAESGRETFAQLDAGLRQVVSHAELEGRPPTTDLAREVLQLDHDRAPTQPSATTIIDAVSQYFSVSADHLAGASRSRQVTYARHIAAYLLREVGGCAVTQIGQLLGGRDHSTVLSAWKRISRERASLPDTASDIDALLSALRPPAVA